MASSSVMVLVGIKGKVSGVVVSGGLSNNRLGKCRRRQWSELRYGSTSNVVHTMDFVRVSMKY